jgi:hypothetical protein
MAALSIAGTALNVVQFEEMEPETKGELITTFDKTLVSTISDEKRKFRVVTAPHSKTVYDAMQSAFANGASFTATGDLFLGDSLTCRGRVSYALVGLGTSDGGYLWNYVLTLTFQEV